MQIRKFGFEDQELMKHSNAIRREVFIEEQHVDPAIEYEYEDQGHYYLLYLDETPIATARWRETSNGIKLERFALLKKYRNKGLGTVLLNEVLSDVKTMNKPIYLHSQLPAVNYYKRVGFKEVGDHFWEADIEHVMMKIQ